MIRRATFKLFIAACAAALAIGGAVSKSNAMQPDIARSETTATNLRDEKYSAVKWLFDAPPATSQLKGEQRRSPANFIVTRVVLAGKIKAFSARDGVLEVLHGEIYFPDEGVCGRSRYSVIPASFLQPTRPSFDQQSPDYMAWVYGLSQGYDDLVRLVGGRTYYAGVICDGDQIAIGYAWDTIN